MKNIIESDYKLDKKLIKMGKKCRKSHHNYDKKSVKNCSKMTKNGKNDHEL